MWPPAPKARILAATSSSPRQPTARATTPEPPAGLPAPLLAALDRARRLGLFSEGDLAGQVEHARGFARAAETLGWRRSGAFLDLGSGGGLPGLVLIDNWPSARAVLLDATGRRAGHLRQALAECGWESRARVVHARAETAGRDPELRARFDLVVARSFGPPATVAECAAPFLRPGGLLVVSEPPVVPGSPPGDHRVAHADRWPAAALAELNLEVISFVSNGAGYQALLQVAPCPERYPRRDGVPAKRPLF